MTFIPKPTIEQMRRELDRRGYGGRTRTWPRCRGLRHWAAALRLRFWSTPDIVNALNRAQVRFDPPKWARECCG